MKGFMDASFQLDYDDFKSCAVEIHILSIWLGHELEEFQQEIVADSTTEVEYITTFEAAKEVVWIRKFIDELKVVSSIVDPITVIGTTMEPSRKRRNHGLINGPNLYCGITI